MSRATKSNRERLIAELRKFATDRGDDLAALFVEGVDAVVTLLQDFGQSLFEHGRSLGDYRETINAVAGLRRSWRSLLTGAWDLVTEWQMYEPVDHHVPLPKVVFRRRRFCGRLVRWLHRRITTRRSSEVVAQRCDSPARPRSEKRPCVYRHPRPRQGEAPRSACAAGHDRRPRHGRVPHVGFGGFGACGSDLAQHTRNFCAAVVTVFWQRARAFRRSRGRFHPGQHASRVRHGVVPGDAGLSALTV